MSNQVQLRNAAPHVYSFVKHEVVPHDINHIEEVVEIYTFKLLKAIRQEREVWHAIPYPHCINLTEHIMYNFNACITYGFMEKLKAALYADNIACPNF
jgi:hypothetical protein